MVSLRILITLSYQSIMESLIPIFGAFIAPLLPFESEHIKMAMGMAISAAIVKLIMTVMGDSTNVSKYLDYFSRNISFDITQDDPFHKILSDYIYHNYASNVVEFDMENDNGMKTTYPKRLRGGYITDTFVYNGNKYAVSIYTKDAQIKPDQPGKPRKPETARSTYTLSIPKCTEPGIINKYIDHVNNKKVITDHTHIYQLFVDRNKNWGSCLRWDQFTLTLSKTIDNTIMSDNVTKNFYQDLDIFMHSELLYKDRGITYKRGYVLYGPPGCGKTSMIKAVSKHYRGVIFVTVTIITPSYMYCIFILITTR